MCLAQVSVEKSSKIIAILKLLYENYTLKKTKKGYLSLLAKISYLNII